MSQKISIYNKLAYALLCFMMGLLVTAFFVSIPFIEKSFGLQIAALQWMEVMMFASGVMTIFFCLNFTSHYGVSNAVMVAAGCILLASLILNLFSNQYTIMFFRALCGISAALTLSVMYFESKRSHLSLTPYLFIFALGILLGPFIAHYYATFRHLLLVGFPLFIALPMFIIVLSVLYMKDNYVSEYIKQERALQLTLLLFLMITGWLTFFFFFDTVSFSSNMAMAAILISLISGLIFIRIFVKSNERLYITQGIPANINYVIIANLMLAGGTLVFWATILPVYMVQILNYPYFHTFNMIGVLNLAIIGGGYATYLLPSNRTHLNMLVTSYVFMALGVISIIMFWSPSPYGQILGATIGVGLGVGMIFVATIQILWSLGIKSSQVLLVSFFYGSCGILAVYVPLVSYFYHVENSVNARLLTQHEILLPEAVATPTLENALVLSNNSELASHFTADQLNQLRDILRTSFNSAINWSILFLVLAAIVVLLLSIHILKKKDSDTI